MKTPITTLKFLLFSITLLPLFAEAQSFYAVRRNRNLLINAGSGIANYKGEMVNPGKFGTLKPNLTIGAEYYVTPRISVRASATWFQLAGDDSKANDDRQERNLHFRSNNYELSLTGALNLSPMGQRFYQRSRLNLHGFVGIGMLRFNPKARYNDEWVALAPLETEGVKYSRIQPVIPIGLGARIKVNPFFNVLIEGGYRVTFTDYLDDVSTVRYIDPALLKSDLSRALADRRDEIGTKPENPLRGRRGNPSSNDGYFIANVTLQYYLPKEIFRNSQRKMYRSKRKGIYNNRR
jgi:hypothetical protein